MCGRRSWGVTLCGIYLPGKLGINLTCNTLAVGFVQV